MRRIASIAVLSIAASACGGPVISAGDAGSDANRVIAARRELERCRQRVATSSDVASITAVVAHINALPAPVTVPCFIASLPRPFTVVATTSVTSAQPAFGPRSPRLFLLFSGLTLSVVAEGAGATLVEFGESSALHRSVKGEIELPWTTPLTAEDPFTRVRYERGSSCGFCHRDEARSPDARGAFDSVALRPINESLVSIEQVRAIPALACASDDDTSAKCLFWHALFDYGPVQQGAFDPNIETLFR